MYAVQADSDNSGNENANTNDDAEKTLVHLVEIGNVTLHRNIHPQTGDNRDDACHDE